MGAGGGTRVAGGVGNAATGIKKPAEAGGVESRLQPIRWFVPRLGRRKVLAPA